MMLCDIKSSTMCATKRGQSLHTNVKVPEKFVENVSCSELFFTQQTAVEGFCIFYGGSGEGMVGKMLIPQVCKQ